MACRWPGRWRGTWPPASRAFTLFATHYFELTALAAELPGVVNLHLDATEHGDELVFLHAVKEGPANRSYGLAVAKLAGVPAPVIAAARGNTSRNWKRSAMRMPLQDPRRRARCPSSAPRAPRPWRHQSPRQPGP